MYQRIIRFFAWWAGLILVMTVGRLLFFVVEPAYGWTDVVHLWDVVVHGLPTDLAMSGYLMIIPGLWLVASVWTVRAWMARLMSGYIWFVAGAISLIYTLDAVLYPYWGFRLDTTPFFYFATSPGASMASLSWLLEVLLVVLIAALTFGLYKALSWLWNAWSPADIERRGRKALATVLLVVCTAGLFIPIRGGLTVATMTPGRGFYSSDMRLNHATVNPMFSLLYSVMHWDDLGSQFRLFDSDDEARRVLDSFEARNTDTSVVLPEVALTISAPDVYVIILESFSAQLMPSLGGLDVATNLDRYATRHGVLFTDFYAESFRTDRGIPAVLSGYPGQPTTSAMRYTGKLGNLPGIAKVLRDNGWQTTYYYGGDADFTNMKAYLMATGFDCILSQEDFDASLRVSKWGVHDGPLFDRVLSEVGRPASKPQLRVIQTSSSHEPFEVPFTSRFSDERLNAFAYTDKVLGDFLDRLRSSGDWDNALVVIVPDHWGCYPRDLRDYTARHHVPLVLTGGALTGAPAKVDVTASQSDIAPTLMGLLGIETDRFVFGHDIFDTASPRYAWFSEPDWFAVRCNGQTTVVTCDGNRVLTGNEADAEGARAFVQLLYSDLNLKR